jgi:hypothetical protein
MPDAAATTAPTARPATLDDLMIAMDVVDTMRHREDLVARELNEAGREAELIQRLKEIYRQQGIEVPDHVLAEGVKALKESRFTYTPPPPSMRRTLFEFYATRRRWGAWVGVAAVLLLGSCGYNYLTVTRPAQQAAEQAQIEIAETLPKAIRQAHADVLSAAPGDRDARERAAALLADGEREIREKDRAGMTKVATDLKQLREEVVREYTLTIVSRPGETSGVWRRPPAGSQVRNYYLVVEAIAPGGAKLSLPIRNEENGRTETVDKFGVRVPLSTFEAVAADKRDDGIIQKNRYGVKKRGTLAIEYQMPFEGGMITRW